MMHQLHVVAAHLAVAFGAVVPPLLRPFPRWVMRGVPCRRVPCLYLPAARRLCLTWRRASLGGTPAARPLALRLQGGCADRAIYHLRKRLFRLSASSPRPPVAVTAAALPFFMAAAAAPLPSTTAAPAAYPAARALNSPALRASCFATPIHARPPAPFPGEAGSLCARATAPRWPVRPCSS